jgi:serine/threonine-protein kinase
MGSVYLCEHVTLGRRYALKILHAARALDPELVNRFRQEAQAASRIAQENVVEVLDYGEEPGGALYYVMEFLGGRTLGQVMRDDGPLPLTRALHLLEQICRALAAAHARGVVHRDVKPDNVLVERLPDGLERAKLIDFGISHLTNTRRLTLDGEVIGTPEYMAPEQAAGGEVDELTDVYAVGVLAFELFTGGLPFTGPTAVATLVAHQTQPAPTPSALRAGLPAELDRLVLRALAKHKADRTESMQALAAEVARLRLDANLASVSGRLNRLTPRDGTAQVASGTGAGGTMSLAAVPYPITPLAAATPTPGPGTAVLASAEQLPALPELAPSPAPGQPRGRGLLLAVTVGLAVAAALAVALALPQATERGWGPREPAARPAAATIAPTATPTVTADPTPAPAPTSAEAPPAALAPIALPPEPHAAVLPAAAPPIAPPRRRAAEPAEPAAAPASDDPLRDPYATPADPLKPDPFR